MASDSDSTSRSFRDEAKRLLHGTSLRIEDAVDSGKRRLAARIGRDRSRYIQPYRSYATSSMAFVRGRVLQNKPAGGPMDDDGLWENLLNTYRRWETDEVPDAPVSLELGGHWFEGRSDEEGYIHFAVPLPTPLPGDALWHEGRLVLGTRDEAASGEPAASLVKVLTVPRSASFGVISDVDDTVLHTGITSLVTAAKLTFLGNAKSRKPLEGVAALYRAFQNGVGGDGEPHRNPIFYVSSSAWNLYDLLEDFLELNDIPLGPIQLRDLGTDSEKFLKSDHRHKLEKALHIVDSYPHLPFLLVGDSGQEDAALYAELVQERPGRVLAIYIRDVDPGVDSARDTFVSEHAEQAGRHDVPFLRVEDSLEIAAHAVELGLLAPAFLETVRAERARDEQREEV